MLRQFFGLLVVALWILRAFCNRDENGFGFFHLSNDPNANFNRIAFDLKKFSRDAHDRLDWIKFNQATSAHAIMRINRRNQLNRTVTDFYFPQTRIKPNRRRPRARRNFRPIGLRRRPGFVAAKVDPIA